MKKILKTIALALAVVMLTSTLCGCSAFIEGFLEGYNEAMGSGTGDSNHTAAVFENMDSEDEEDALDYDNDTQSYDSPEEEAADVFASNTGNYDESDIVGEWIDLDNEIINFKSNGTCNYFGTRCEAYHFDGEFLVLICDGEEYKYPARLYRDHFVIFYEPYYFARKAGDVNSLIGRWESSDDNNYSFEFYSDGSFLEDDEYTGTYHVNGMDMILLYDDNTISYGLFNIHEDGNQLGYAYGWTLEKVTD